MKSRKLNFLLATSSALLLAPTAFAQNQNGTWNVTTTPGSWATPGNWVGSAIANGSGFTANFNSVDIPGDTTVNLDGARTIGNLVFGDTTIGTAGSWILANGTGGPLTLAGTTPTITVNALGTDKNAQITATLGGISGFTKAGAGVLILNNAGNTISGAIVLSAGVLQLNSASLSNATTVAINAGTLVVAAPGANAIGGTISFGGGTLQYNINPVTDYSGQFSTTANQQYKINVISVSGTPRVVTYASDLASPGGTLAKLSTGTLILAAANTFTGATTVASGGTLQLNNARALQNSALDTANIGGGTLVLNTGIITPTFGGLTGSTALASLFNSTTGNYGFVTNLTLNPGTGASPSYAAAIANGAPGGMTLTKTGAGTQILTVASSYTGGTAINGGILSIGNAAALGTTGTISFGGGTLQYNGITTDLSSRFSTAASQAYSVDTNSQTVTWAGALSSSGGSLTKTGAGTLTLAGGEANAFAGSVAVNGGTLAGTAGTSLKNVTGAITVASGATLNFDQNFTANNLTNALTLSGTGDGSFGALNLTRNAVVTGGITLAADTRITKGFNNATIQTGAITGSGRNLQLTTTSAGQPGLVITSAIQTGAGGVSVTGAANSGNYSVQLGGNNTFTGGLTINNGVVQLNSAGALNSTAGSENAVTFGASTTTGKLALNGRSYTISNLTSNATSGSPVVENGNAAAVTLTVGNSQNLSGTYAGVLQDGSGGGALSVTKAGTGALTLSGLNTYTGATQVNAGKLLIGTSGSLGASAVTIGGATATGTPTLGGGGTITGATVIAAASGGAAGTHAPGVAGVANGVGTQTFSNSLTYANGSIFEWDINANDTASGFDTAVVSGDLTGGASSIFRVVFGTTAKAGVLDTGNAFWNTANASQVWNMTTLFGKNFKSGAFGSVQTYDSVGFFDVSSKGSFGITGSTLTWTAVPEPTSALAGVLLTAGLLRRRRR